MLSIVIPAYNEEKMIWKTTEVVSGIMEREKIPFELVFVMMVPEIRPGK